jgi:hypothetical protein
MSAARADRIFLLSPASTAGKRAQLLLNEKAIFDLAVRIRSAEGVALGEVFSFLSGLYFRGKLTYARQFAGSESAIRVITSDRGLVSPDQSVTIADLRAMAAEAIDHAHDPYRLPLIRHAEAIRAASSPTSEIVLLGSIATEKYVAILSEVFGPRLMFPSDFVGRGDMSRGGLLLRCAREGRELDYTAVATAIRRGKRPPKLE